jgi:hypothetical protein
MHGLGKARNIRSTSWNKRTREGMKGWPFQFRRAVEQPGSNPGPRPNFVLKFDHSEAYAASARYRRTAISHEARPPRARVVQWRQHRPEWPGPLFHGIEELSAGLLAASTGLFADPAVLVHLGMPLALVTTAFACDCARLQQRPRDL